MRKTAKKVSVAMSEELEIMKELRRKCKIRKKKNKQSIRATTEALGVFSIISFCSFVFTFMVSLDEGIIFENTILLSILGLLSSLSFIGYLFYDSKVVITEPTSNDIEKTVDALINELKECERIGDRYALLLTFARYCREHEFPMYIEKTWKYSKMNLLDKDLLLVEEL